MTILKIHEQSLLLQYEFVDLNNLLGASSESDNENNLLQHWWVFVIRGGWLCNAQYKQKTTIVATTIT